MLNRFYAFNSTKKYLPLSLVEYLWLNDWQILHTNPQNKPEEQFGFAHFISTNLQGAEKACTEAELLFIGLKNSNLENGLCIELGTYLGRSARTISTLLSVLSPSAKLFTIDSFEGLPESWREGFPKGKFALSENERPQLPDNCVQLVGYFSQVLPDLDQYLKQLGEQAPIPIAFLHVDCDTYSSTKEALHILHKQDRFVAGTVIVFDEYGNYDGWENGEHKALMEFLGYSGFTPRWLARNINHQGVAVQLSI